MVSARLQKSALFSRTFGSDINLRDYPAILVMGPNLDPIRPALADYTGTKYKLNWWFPEDYKGLSPSVIMDALSDPEQRGRLIKFLLYREPLNQLGAREFYLFVRKDFPGIGHGPNRPSTEQACRPGGPIGSPVNARKRHNSRPIGCWMRPANRSSWTRRMSPWTARAEIYVTEGRANRVTILKRDGSVLCRFGEGGTGNGQLNEPWGIAVADDGEIYVADTWNHRIQRFDSDGRFLNLWGTLGDSQGQLGVARANSGDPVTSPSLGRPRLRNRHGEQTDPDFRFRGNSQGALGGEGSAPGGLREPVGCYGVRMECGSRTPGTIVYSGWDRMALR